MIERQCRGRQGRRPASFAPKCAAGLALAGALCLGLAAGSASAQQASLHQAHVLPIAQKATGPAQDVAPRVELDLAARQRTLVARMAASQCLISADLSAPQNRKRYAGARAAFVAGHHALHDGDLSLRVRPEQNARVLSIWHELDTQWPALDGAYRTSPLADETVRLEAELARTTNDLVAEIRAARAPSMGHSGMQEALMIDLYQRQAMLSQIVTHQVCRIYLGDATSTTAQTILQEVLPIFEGSLNAFLAGLPEAGVAPPRNAAQHRMLTDAARTWQDVAPIATRIAQTNAASRGDTLKILEGTEAFLPYMTQATALLQPTRKNL